MDSVKTLRGYGKVAVAVADERALPERNRQRRLAIAGLSTVLLLLLVAVVLVVVGVSGAGRGNRYSSAGGGVGSPAGTGSVKAVCSVVRKELESSCYSSLSAVGANSTSDPEEIFKLSLRVAMDEISRIATVPDAISKGVTDQRAVEALKVCKEMLSSAVDHLNASLESLRPPPIDDLKTWLSAALTDQETCLDSFDGQYTSNSLAIAAHLISIMEQLQIPIHRRLLSTTATAALQRRFSPRGTSPSTAAASASRA
ncbi:unnamed protein product [Spirodela intermedia]|uniref:Pectinesterase inhibitor domain-containing protein n=1 Tax=Spirodela intermedia TaxID=51605 RepID=A0A7I8ILA1_SPIIN|nr:unnamed protein product [Spirodela intermedia]CAA6658711.1 unnamed protein product [Spirodela intermedia]